MGYEQRTSVSPSLDGLDGEPPAHWLSSAVTESVRASEDRPFSDTEYEARLGRVRARMARTGLDGLIVFRPSSVEYLCGFHTAETAPQPLLVTESDTFLYVPDLEVGRALASSRVGNVRYAGYADALGSLERFLDHAVGVLPRAARVGVEAGHASTPPKAARILEDRRVEVVDPDYLVERVRLVLSPGEIRCVEQAATATSAGVEGAIAEAGKPGATDASVAAAIVAQLFEHANSPAAWGPVVVTGQRAGIPHSSWVGQSLCNGPTFLEFAGTHHRYHAPVMRTLMAGTPDATERRLRDLARTALNSVLENARPGVPCRDVATRASRALGRMPDDVVFHQLFGYPVGLAHKPHWMDGAPFHITADNHEPLQEGMVFHVPASFRSFGRTCVGLSQTFVVEQHGTRVLTQGQPELIGIEERTA
ncbi:M24 family metallopeptidase [Parasphingorhabdus pacifica]